MNASPSSWRLAARIARRELRGGINGFRLFLICLALGVAAIAAIGSVREGINAGLEREGAAMLGGQAEMEFTYRFATEVERAWMKENAISASEVVDFRSMIVVGNGNDAQRALTQVKAVDNLYPLVGNLRLTPNISLPDAFAEQDGRPGLVLDGAIINRLGLKAGDIIKLGLQEFHLSAEIEFEPDAAAGGFALGPRSIVMTKDLNDARLLAPGSLFTSKYRLKLPEDTDLEALKTRAMDKFRDTGLGWHDARRASPGIERFVNQPSAFLVLVGLAGLAVGGVGVSAAVRAYLARKTATIAVLRTIGATRGLIFKIYALQILTLSILGVVIGLILGGGLPLIFAPLITANLPFPIEITLYPAALIEAGIFGFLTAILFALWPLSKTENIKPAALFRAAFGSIDGLPRLIYICATISVALILIATAAALSPVKMLTLYTAGSIICAILALVIVASGLRRLAHRVGRSPILRGMPALRLAISAVGGPQEEARAVILSLGLGLTVLATVGQIDSNLRDAIERDLPKVAPSYFYVDIQNDQLPGFMDRLSADETVSKVQTAPMLRGLITRINGKAPEIGHWILNGDRGITYSNVPPENTVITQGNWWEPNYNGTPQISFAAEEAAEMGLSLGDTLTVNILGRDITATITSFREVDFSTAGIGFIMSMNPSALAGAPHTSIATVYADEVGEAAIERDLAVMFPNITAIRVRDAIERVASILSSMASAISYGAAMTLVTGFVVLVGAAAATENARVYEAAILKNLGASRFRIVASFALRSIILGTAAGVVALIAGATATWAVMRFVMEVEFTLNWTLALGVILAGIAVTLFAGMIFAWRPLATKPAQILRLQE